MSEESSDVREVILKTTPNPKISYGDHPDIKHAVESLKQDWLKAILISVGLTEDQFVAYESEETVEAMGHLDLEVFKCSGNELAVKQSGVFIGEWAAPNIIVLQEDDQWIAHLELEYWPDINF